MRTPLKPKKKRYLEAIIREFDWERVERTMQALDWTWARYNRVPTISEMKDSVRDMAVTLKEYRSENHDITEVGTGGFILRKWGKGYELAFEVARWDNEEELYGDKDQGQQELHQWSCVTMG